MANTRGRILVVDDDRTNRMMLTYRLEVSGLDTATAENGRQALEKLREEPFDLILLDIVMPDLDGYSTLEIVKHDPQLRDTPVIMMSSLGDMDSVIRCLEVGAEDYLPKPLDALLLSSRVNAILLKAELSRLEHDYRSVMDQLADAAAKAAEGHFQPQDLADLSRRDDPSGRLAREITRLAEIRLSD